MASPESVLTNLFRWLSLEPPERENINDLYPSLSRKHNESYLQQWNELRTGEQDQESNSFVDPLLKRIKKCIAYFTEKMEEHGTYRGKNEIPDVEENFTEQIASSGYRIAQRSTPIQVQDSVYGPWRISIS